MPRSTDVTAPGAVLQGMLDKRGWTQADFAAIVDRPLQAINEIITAKKSVTPETARAFSEALDTTAEYWLELESSYRLAMLQRLAHDEGRISRRSRLYAAAPINELLKRRWINATRASTLDDLEHEVCRFLGVASLDERPEVRFVARKTRPNDPHTSAQVAWVRRVQVVASTRRVPSFDKAALRRLVGDVPRASRTEASTRQIPDLLAQIGIRFTVVEPLSNTRIDGAALWLTPSSPVIAVTLRFDRVDAFWFTLMHELAHVLNDDGQHTFLDTELIGKSPEPTDERSDVERRADESAAEWLIPREQFDKFVSARHGYGYRGGILAFAETLGIHPAIVVGRLQHLGLVPWSHHRNLLTRIRGVLHETVLPISGA